LQKLEGYKNPCHGHRFPKKLAAIVWIRPWRREIGQALVAPDVIFRKTALRAGALQREIAEISRDRPSPMEAERGLIP
jgi:hypothetical protein